jgi:hypothetical protein
MSHNKLTAFGRLMDGSAAALALILSFALAAGVALAGV